MSAALRCLCFIAAIVLSVISMPFAWIADQLLDAAGWFTDAGNTP